MQDQLSEAGFQFDDVWNGNAQANSPHTQSVVAAFATPDGSQPTFHSQRTDNDVWMDRLSAKPPTVASANPGVRPAPLAAGTYNANSQAYRRLPPRWRSAAPWASAPSFSERLLHCVRICRTNA